VKDFLSGQKHSREHTFSKGFLAWATVSSPGRQSPYLGETTFSPRQGTSRLGENSSESILAPRNHSCLGEMLSLGRIMQNTTTYQTIHAVFTITELLHMP